MTDTPNSAAVLGLHPWFQHHGAAAEIPLDPGVRRTVAGIADTGAKSR